MKTITISGGRANKVNDTSTILHFYIWNDGVPQNTTGKVVQATIANATGYLFDVPMTIDGYELALDFANDSLRKLTAGDYQMEIKVTNADNDVEIYPTNGVMPFTVTQDLTESDSDLLPIVTFDALLKSVDEKIDKYKATIAKGEPGESGKNGVDGLPGKDGKNGKDGVDGWQNLSVNIDHPLDLNAVSLNKKNNQNVLVLTDAFDIYNKAVVVDSAKAISASINAKALTNGGKLALLFFDKTNQHITASDQSLSFTNINSSQVYELENVTVPENAHTVVLRLFSETEGVVVQSNEPIVSAGETADTNNNLVTNAEFSVGLDGWYGDANLSVAPDATTTYLEVDTSNTNYKIEVGSALSGTLPNGIIRGKMSGSKLTVVGASENGVGGLTQTLVIHGKTYQRSFGYQWYDWQMVTGVYGSFDSAGVWHSPYGQPVLGGIIFNPDDDQYYALAPDGKPYTTTGWQTLPIGVNKANLTVKLAENGAIDSDISDSDAVTNYITKVNGYVDKLDDLGSAHIVVTDSHGASVNNVMKTFDRTMSGYQYAKLKKGVITPATMYVSDNDVANMTSNYFASISRKYANRSSLNIQRITSKFNKQPLVYSHLGDVEDGRNANAEEEVAGYQEAASNFLRQGYNMIDGNHDEQHYDYERTALNYQGKEIGNVVNGMPFSRRVAEDRWHDSYGKDKSYYSIYDGEHKLVYIYLDVFEGDKVRYAHQPTPNFGLPLGQAKLTAAQLEWLSAELLKVPDDHFVVINAHMLPDPSLIGTTATGKVADSWWYRNINPDVLTELLIAFQKSQQYVGSSNITNVGQYDFSDYQANINVNFTGKLTDRIAVINYGHHHSYGHVDKSTNGHFNIVQFPNMLGKTWGYIGNPSSSQFGTEIFDVTNRKMTVVRFAPTDDQDAEFTLDF